MDEYIVKQGQNIYDCLLCITGNLSQLDLFLTINSISSYTPVLQPGQVLKTTGLVKADNEALLRAEKYPFANEELPEEDLAAEIKEIWDILDDNLNYSGYLESSDKIPLRDINTHLLYSKQ